jgi:plastocyanin
MSGAPRTQRITRPEDLSTIVFSEEGMAAVMAPAELLDRIAFKNDQREESPRLAAVRRSIETHGYDPTQPIIVRVGQKGKWVVVDGGHRLTAVRQICGSWWKRTFCKRIGDLYFLLFLTPRSYAKEPGLRPTGAYAPAPSKPTAAAR